MRKLLPGLLILISLLLGIFLLLMGLGMPGRDVSPELTPLSLSLQGPEAAHVGQILPVTLNIWGDQPVGELTVEVAISTPYLQVRDYDADIPGIQAMPLTLPESAQLQQNEVGSDGVLRYQVSGLGSSVIPSGTLLLIPLTPVASGLGEVTIQAVVATKPDGTRLPVQSTYSSLEIAISAEGETSVSRSSPVSPLSLKDASSAPFGHEEKEFTFALSN